MLSAMDYHYLMRELSVLEGARVNKIYQDSEDKRVFLFDVHVPGKGSKWLQIVLPEAMYLTDEKFTTGEPTGFCAFLRKKCSGFKILSFKQLGFERIFKMELGTREKHVYSLYIEMFSKGNLILTEANDRIQGLLVHKNFGTRNLRGGETYKLPPAQANTLELSLEEFSKLLKESKKELVKALATDLGLGGEYAEILLERAKLSKTEKLSDVVTKKLHFELKKLVNEKISPSISDTGVTALGNGEFQTYSEALKEYVNKIVFAEKPKENKTEKIREAQHEKIAEYEKQAVEYQRIGESIYEHYSELKKIIEDAKKGKFEKAKKIDHKTIQVEL